MRPLRLGLIPFVGTLPLIRGLETDRTEGLELVYDRPSGLADKLRHGELDGALIPSVEFFRGVGDGIVPGLCLASDGPVESVRFVANKPIGELRQVLVDKGSRSAVAMLRLLLRRTHDVEPDFCIFDPHPDFPLTGPDGQEADAALLIGDLAMALDPGEAVLDLDLGEWWGRSFHRPFVYAFWAYRDREGEKLVGRLTELLHDSFERGRREMDLIVEEAAVAHLWDESRVRRHLGERVRHEMDAEALDGLRLFHSLCVEDHLAPYRLSVDEALAALGPAERAEAARAR